MRSSVNQRAPGVKGSRSIGPKGGTFRSSGGTPMRLRSTACGRPTCAVGVAVNLKSMPFHDQGQSGCVPGHHGLTVRTQIERVLRSAVLRLGCPGMGMRPHLPLEPF